MISAMRQDLPALSVPEDNQAHLAAETFRMLADPTRVKLLWALLQGESSVTGLAELARVSPTSVSQHLAKLRLAGLVSGRREGTFIYYTARHLGHRAGAALRGREGYLVPRVDQTAGKPVHNCLDAAVALGWDGQPRWCDQPHQHGESPSVGDAPGADDPRQTSVSRGGGPAKGSGPRGGCGWAAMPLRQCARHVAGRTASAAAR